MPTYPYKYVHIIYGMDECQIVLVNIDKNQKLGLSERFVQFMLEHGRCAFCDSTLESTLRKCKCAKPKSRNEHLYVKYSQTLHHSVLLPILEIENKRKKLAIRNERMKENGGTHTKQELKILIEMQENSCYFCGTEIELKNSSKKAHADHYESIFEGGRNDIQNIVMTCSACNLKKGASDGDYFETLIRKNRSSETSKKLRAIRRKIKILKEELQALNLKAPRKSLKTV